LKPCVPRPTTAGSEVKTAMTGNNSESSMEANTSQDGQGAAAEVFDNYRSLRDSNLMIFVAKNVGPPFRFKAGSLELTRSSTARSRSRGRLKEK
jgi:hypothetical protein